MKDLHIGTLEYQDKKQIKGVEAAIEDEILPQLSIHTVDEGLLKALIKKLAEGEVYQNWKMEPIPIMLKK